MFGEHHEGRYGVELYLMSSCQDLPVLPRHMHQGLHLLTSDIAVRALRNPELFRYDHFRQAALAIAVGVAIQLIIQIPVCSSTAHIDLHC